MSPFFGYSSSELVGTSTDGDDDRLDITFRRDTTSHRPRINKMNSVLDKEQKASGKYFFVDTP